MSPRAIAAAALLTSSLCAASGTAASDASTQVTPQPWQTPLARAGLPRGLPDIRASSCAVCHRQAAREWSRSAHAHAWRDPQFQGEWAKDGRPDLCLSCHTPLPEQADQGATALRDEGVTCAACHVRHGTVLAPRDSPAAPHAIVTDRAAMGHDACLRCHEAQARVSATLVCAFTTGSDWKRSPAARDGKNCVSCHMRTSDGHVRHDFPGMGVAKAATEAGDVLDGYRPGLDVRLAFDQESYGPGDEVAATVTVTNTHAGHPVPTGDVERFVEVEASLLRTGGDPIATERVRFGERWEWWPVAKKLADERLAPGSSRTMRLRGRVPRDSGAGDVILTVTVTNHRITDSNAAVSRLGIGYPRRATVARHEARARILGMPVRKKG